MKTRIVRIGNSRGIRIPKPLLEQTGLHGEVAPAGPPPFEKWRGAATTPYLTRKRRACPTGMRTSGNGNKPLRGLSRQSRSDHR
jgi:hypothetical protein